MLRIPPSFHSTCYVFTHQVRSPSWQFAVNIVKGHRFNSLRDFESWSPKCTFLKCNEPEVRFAGRQKDTCGGKSLVY